MEGYLVEPRYKGESFGHASGDVTEFVDSPQEASPSLGGEWGVGLGA